MSAVLAAVLLVSGAFYVSRLAPRVAQRAAAARGGAVGLQSYQRYEAAFEPVMSEREAMLVLGFPEKTASGIFTRPQEQEVRERYLAHMKRMHSDVSGSPLVSRKLNEARDLLLRR